MYCAGKNYVASLLEKRGLPVLDLDKLGHRAIDSEKEAVIARFGPDVLGEGGAIDRRRLGQKVFEKSEELAALEALVHPAVDRLTEAWLREQTGEIVVLNAAVLHKSAYFKRVTGLILVEAPFLVRLVRAKKRDRLSWKVLLKRFASQNDFRAQYSSVKADIYRVENRTFLTKKGRNFNRKLENRIDEILAGEGW
jgi:dephospho-CoA kinase